MGKGKNKKSEPHSSIFQFAEKIVIISISLHTDKSQTLEFPVSSVCMINLLITAY